MDRSNQELLLKLHSNYNNKTHPGVDTSNLESHITRLIADAGFLTRDEATELHEEYHMRTGPGGELVQHPAVLLYGDTESKWLPIMLVVGQEPNDSRPMKEFVWTYDFDHPKAQFWSVAYKMFAQVNGLGLDEFRERCRAWHGSPIAFADASPMPIKARVAGKSAIRSEITPQRFREHVDDVFSMQTHMASLKERLNLVVLSGLKQQIFGPAVEQIIQHCNDGPQKIPHISMWFFRWTFYDKIMVGLDETAMSSMRHIFMKWETHLSRR